MIMEKNACILQLQGIYRILRGFKEICIDLNEGVTFVKYWETDHRFKIPIKNFAGELNWKWSGM